jgi:hypothetical protein
LKNETEKVVQWLCNEQKRGKQKYVIFIVLGKLLKRWIPWWSACGSVSPSPSLKQFPFQIPYNLDHFFNSQLQLTIPFCLFNSLILQYLPHVTHFLKSSPLSHFPQTVPTLPYPFSSFIWKPLGADKGMDGHIHIKQNEGYHIIPRHLVWRGILNHRL